MEIVCHYTTIDSLWHLIESIQDSKDKDSFIFRATHIMFMNDPQEFIFGQKILRDVFIEIENELEIDAEHRLSGIWDKAEKDSQNRGMSLLNYLKSNTEIPYVISFSRLEDNLQMWLNYGNRGKGVCLVFEDNRNQPYKVKFINGKRVRYESFYTSDVYYKELPKDSSLYNIIRETIISYKEDVDGGYTDIQEPYLEALIQTAAPHIKTSFYENEKEVRVTKSLGCDYLGDVDKVRFRSNGNSNLIPYIDVEIPHYQLKIV